MDRLKDKVVFITGGASGIGKASAIEAAAQGAKVVIADLETSKHDEALAEIRNAGNGEVLFVPINVADAASIESAIAATVKHFGRIDVAFNNAGIGADGKKLAEEGIDVYRRVIGINLDGVYLCMQKQIQQFLKQGGGVIVNTASAMGLVAMAQNSPYVVSKHGVVGLTKAAALEYGTNNIRVNAICPGYIDTPILGDLPEEARAAIIAQHPIGRLGKAEEVAKAFIFLASDDASFITGAALAVDGGFTAV